MKNYVTIAIIIMGFSVTLRAQEKVLYFDWYSIPAYTNYASTGLLEPGNGEIGFGTSNFCMWSNDTASYDTRTLDLLFRLGVLPHMEIGIKYSSPLAVVLDARGGFEKGRFEFTGSFGAGYLHHTKFIQPGNYTFYLLDGYPTLGFGWKINKWLRAVLSCKGIVSYYSLQTKQAIPRQEFFTIHGGPGITLDVGIKDWFIRPELIQYWGVTYSNLTDSPTRFKVMNFGVSVVYRPKGS